LALLATGKHNRGSYTALLFALKRGGHSGTLTVKYGRRKRELLFIVGEPVLYRSDLSEDAVDRTLVSSGLVPADRVRWIVDKLGPDESVETALIMSGAISEEKLSEHKLQRLPIGIGSPFVWRSGDWSFSPLAGFSSDNFDPSLLPSSSGLKSLWKVIRKEMATNDVMMEITSGNKGGLSMSPDSKALLGAVDPAGPLNQIADAIGDGCSVEALFGKIPDTSGDLFKLLWMLEAGGVVLRENVSDNGQLDDQLNNMSESGGSSSVATAPSKDKGSEKSTQRVAVQDSGGTPEKAVKNGVTEVHSAKMGSDFYTFLGIDQSATRREVDRACKSMAKKWRPVEGDKNLSEEQAVQVKELLAGVQLVWRTLTDPKHKKEYDRRLEAGRAPKVEVNLGRRSTVKPKDIKPSPVEENKPAPVEEKGDEAARGIATLIESKKYSEAQSVLEDSRVDNPCDPFILASLGWVNWMILDENPSSSSEDPIEFIDLALTFDSRNMLALEYKAKILLSKGANSQARAVLKRLLTVEPRAQWAKTALQNISDSGAGNSAADRKRRFWRNKGDR
jgi:hypothetical protein